MENKIEFTQEELQLLYAACSSYGNKLSDMAKEVPNESFIADGLAKRASESWKLSVKLCQYMDM